MSTKQSTNMEHGEIGFSKVELGNKDFGQTPEYLPLVHHQHHMMKAVLLMKEVDTMGERNMRRKI